VKLAEDRSGDVIVRLYEALGGRAATTVSMVVPGLSAWTTDLLERPNRGQSWAAGEAIHLSFAPFQIATLRMRTPN
jgi:alpha-mannosidase